MRRVMLTNTMYLKKNTPIEDNVNDDLLKPFILKSQETHIQAVVGTTLYNKIINDVISINSIQGFYKTLLNEYIIPSLIEWSFYEALPFISIKINNKSIGRGNADYMVEGDLSDLKYLRSTIRDVAEFYDERIIGYIKDNINEFPEYYNNGSNDLKPLKTSYFSGVYLGKSIKNKR